jgi:putative methionine-R-sulfoxide reductase with GAF domain
MIHTPRDYTPLLTAITPAPGGDTEALMQRTVDALWNQFKDQGLSWIGFYTWSHAKPDEMTLARRQPKPACSPIGLHGACGRCWQERRPLVVTDVKKLGANYVACDPRDQSEVVVPLLNPDGTCWGVLDADSFDVGAFDYFDALSLARLMRHIGLSAGGAEQPEDVIVI